MTKTKKAILGVAISMLLVIFLTSAPTLLSIGQRAFFPMVTKFVVTDKYYDDEYNYNISGWMEKPWYSSEPFCWYVKMDVEVKDKEGHWHSVEWSATDRKNAATQTRNSGTQGFDDWKILNGGRFPNATMANLYVRHNCIGIPDTHFALLRAYTKIEFPLKEDE